MNSNDSMPSASLEARPASKSAPRRRRWVEPLFWAYLMVVLYFTLRPYPGGGRLHEAPGILARLINDNDLWSNVLAFALLGVLGFLESRRPDAIRNSSRLGRLREWFNTRSGRAIALLGLVAAIELLQTWIPGRVPDPADIVAGWLGILGALLVCRTRRLRS